MPHHHHGNCAHENHEFCDHGDGPDRGIEFTLYTQIDMLGVRCLNEVHTDDGHCQKIFKPWDMRFEQETYIESDADEQLIVHIPFTSNIKLKSIAVLGFNDASAPSQMHAFTNNNSIDFDNVNDTPTIQEWELVSTIEKNVIPEYPTKMARFASIRSLTLLFPSNFGAATTRISYIGLKGEWTAVTRDPIVTVYELAANPADHKSKVQDTQSHAIQ